MNTTHTNYKGLNYAEKSASSNTEYRIKLFYWNKWNIINIPNCICEK